MLSCRSKTRSSNYMTDKYSSVVLHSAVIGSSQFYNKARNYTAGFVGYTRVARMPHTDPTKKNAMNATGGASNLPERTSTIFDNVQLCFVLKAQVTAPECNSHLRRVHCCIFNELDTLCRGSRREVGTWPIHNRVAPQTYTPRVCCCNAHNPKRAANNNKSRVIQEEAPRVGCHQQVGHHS